MSDPESGLTIAEPLLPFARKSSEGSSAISTTIGCCGPVAGWTRTDNEHAFSHVMQNQGPIFVEKVEVDVSKDFLTKTSESMVSTVHTIVGCSGPVAGWTRTDNEHAFSHAMQNQGPIFAEKVEVDVSKDFLTKTSESMVSAVHTIDGCSGPVAGWTRTDNEHDFSYAMQNQGPIFAEKVEVDVSKDFLTKTWVSMVSAVPTRWDCTKGLPTIYKVPKELKRGEDDEGYEPVAACIGLFTRRNNNRGRSNNTSQLEKYKWCCVRRLIVRMDPCMSLHEGPLKSCLESMKHLEPYIRLSYSQDIEDNSDELALNMLLDGCFILHRLLKYARIWVWDDDWKQLFGRIWVWQLVTSDLLLLENQIPFSVVRKLFELLSWPYDQLHSQEASTQGSDNGGVNLPCSPPLFTVVLHYVCPWARLNPRSTPIEEPTDVLLKGSLKLFRSLCPHMVQRSASTFNYDNVHHLLHLFYLSVVGPVPTSQPRETDGKPSSSHQAADDLVLDLPQWIPSAKELEEAGVRFRKAKDAKRFLDVKFNKRSGVLEIPQLSIYDFSDKLFRNLIAFEQTYPGTWFDITTYAVFMDCLINTPEDMRILHLRGILVNQINGEQDASRFFSRISAQVRWSADKNYLKDLMDEVNEYRSYKHHKWRAYLVRNYFSNPWVTISALAAGILLLLTILQTIFTGITTFNPPK